MKVELRNIGPLNRAEIDLDGLAVLVGPNASGKTTLSTACYAVLISHEYADDSVRELLIRHALGRSRGTDTPSPEGLGEQFALLLRDRLSRELERCSSPDLSKLPRRGRTGHGSAPRLIVSDSSPANGAWKVVFRIKDGALTLEPRHPDYLAPDFKALLESHESQSLTQILRRQRRAGTSVTPVYFPAARSGYVQMQTVLSSLLLAALGRGYFDQLSLGKISGIAADFLQFLAEMEPGAESSLPDVAVGRLERELLHGHLRLNQAGEAKVIEFAPDGIDEYWPMDSAATSIAEVAPLLLYLRHRASTQDLMFIDEPEAHLHPKNQLVLADVLLELSGLLRGMVVGTHSEFFVTGISNGLLRRRTNGTTRAAPVSLYELVPAKTTGGYEGVRIRVDEEAGFSVDQFATVAEAALDEAEALFERATVEAPN